MTEEETLWRFRFAYLLTHVEDHDPRVAHALRDHVDVLLERVRW